MSLSLDTVVDVTINISPQSPAAQGFGKALILGQATVLGLYQRVKEYDSITAVGLDFATNTQEYQAAAIWFSQRKKPRTIKIGRRFLAAQAGQLRGGGASSVVADYTGIDDGAFDITINGTNRQISAIDWTSATTMAQVATAIQTRLAAALASTTCTWDGSRFVITSPTTGIASIVLFAVAPTGGSSPTDVSSLLALTVDDGARSVAGIALEAQTDALNASMIFDPDFYGITNTKAAIVQDEKDTAAWAQSVKKAFFYTTNDINTYDTAATSDLFYFLKNLGYDYSLGAFSAASPYAAVSAMAKGLTVNLDLPNSAITLNLKTLPGVAVDDLNSTQVAAIKAKYGNVYVNIGSSPAFTEGRMASGRFFDEVMGLDWLEARLKEAVFGKLYGTPTKIPQTDAGVATLVQACEGVCSQAKSNGLAGAGTWTGDDVGELTTGTELENGYYVHAEPVASMSQADKENRLAPPITVCLIGAGALHGANITVNFQR